MIPVTIQPLSRSIRIIKLNRILPEHEGYSKPLLRGILINMNEISSMMDPPEDGFVGCYIKMANGDFFHIQETIDFIIDHNDGFQFA